MRTWLRDVAALTLVAASSLAAAQTKATTADAVNVRAGPDRMFPTVTWLLGGTTVDIVGCVPSWRWCDVIAGGHRGWVYARYLAYRHDGRQVRIVAGGPALGLPSID